MVGPKIVDTHYPFFTLRFQNEERPPSFSRSQGNYTVHKRLNNTRAFKLKEILI